MQKPQWVIFYEPYCQPAVTLAPETSDEEMSRSTFLRNDNSENWGLLRSGLSAFFPDRRIFLTIKVSNLV